MQNLLPGLYQTYCDYNSRTFYLTINNVTDTYNGKYIECMYTSESEVGRVRTTLNVQSNDNTTSSNPEDDDTTIVNEKTTTCTQIYNGTGLQENMIQDSYFVRNRPARTTYLKFVICHHNSVDPPDSTPSLTQIPNGPIIEGNTVRLICNIFGGNPLASIVWQCIGFTYVSQTGNNYAVSVIERVVTKDDNGKECRCIIKHPLLDPDKEVRSTLNVYYAPTILRLQASNGNMVDEHQSVTFQCEVDSNPAPDITWIHSTTGTLLNKVEKVFKSNFTILKTECLQTGTYRCQASNVIGDMSKTVYAEIDLFVLCSARMDQRRMDAPVIVAIMENDDWNITVYLIAYPEPMISWTRRNSETGMILIMNVYNSFSISEHSSTLSIRNISKSDYGFYTMNASNNIGFYYIKSFEVIPLDPPDQPTDILATCSISIIVSWRSGFNGGSQQKFRVAWLNIRNQNTKYSPEIMDSGLGQPIQYIIKSLEPSTIYTIYVEATNKRGVVKSGNVHCITRSSTSITLF
ncbi:unnamed protein product [Mytilus edulis]|uniref:Uncharacterized protein n=1 Tax=Mytilus edulis TaxID=6550 RepID=A0A8S3TWG2_MYTED|nr:unnamed protein product [Mytilus edulis]